MLRVTVDLDPVLGTLSMSLEYTLDGMQDTIHTLVPPIFIFLGDGRKAENLKAEVRCRNNMQNRTQRVSQAQDQTQNPAAMRQQD